LIRPFASRRVLPLLPIAIVTGGVITCALVALAFQNEIAHEKDVFASQSRLVYDGVARRLTATEEVARSLVMLFNASDQVNADEFRLFADETLHRFPFVRSFLYLPLVQDRDRRAFERGMREEGYAIFSIKERRQDRDATAPRRDRYFPVRFIEPYSPTAAREIGRDLLVESTSGQAMVWAVDTAGPVMSWPPERELGGFVYTVFNATYEGKTAPNSIDARRRAVNGIVAVRVNAQALLDNLPGTDHTLITLAIHSPRTDEPPVDLASYRDPRFDEPDEWAAAALSQSDDFAIAGQHVALNLRRTIALEDMKHRLLIVAGAVGLALTGLLSAIARSVISRATALERINVEIADEVAARTRELAVEKDRALVTLESIGDGVITTDARGRVEYLNPVAERLTAYTPGDAAGRDAAEVFAIVHASTRQPADDSVIACLREARVVDVSEPVVLIGRTGAETAVALTVAPIHDRDGRVSGTVLVFRDVTQARAMAERMNHQATHDALTNLPNRILLMDRLEQALLRCPWHERLVAVIFLDLDHFKLVNDTLGHDVGDQLLRQVAERLTASVRQGDTVCRIGGDEFVVLLTDIAARADVLTLAEKIITRLDEPYRLGGQDYFCSASAGINIAQEEGMTPAVLLKNADVALYRAKDSGRSNYQFFSEDMNKHAIQALQTKTGLRHALDRNELVVHYQPQVDLRTGMIIGAEALVRWNHPTKGMIPPMEFIPVAEESGLIFPISEWVLAEACTQVKRWRDAGLPNLRMAVNLSGRQFRQIGLAEHIQRLLEKVGLAPEWLELELTESTLVKDAAAAIVVCKELKAIGVWFAIDDFGTGYSSLSYLKRFPVDTLKVDRSFIKELPGNDEDAAICTAIVAMAHSLNLSVMAEGVETTAQRDLLARKGFDAAQGYLFGRPVPGEDLTALLRATHPPQAANG
jgi:diguanylate cyclase (GGDEF)-like protein/PAS domain S-box-containing protein